MRLLVYRARFRRPRGIAKNIGDLEKGYKILESYIKDGISTGRYRKLE